MGYGKAYALKGGWEEWVRLGFPVVKNTTVLETLIRKTIEEYGGEAALRRASAARHTGKVTSLMRGGMTGSIIREFAHPDRLRVFIRYGSDSEVRVFDGNSGWREGKTVNGPPLDAMILQAARLSLPLVLIDRQGDWIDRGVSTFEGKEVRNLELPLGKGLTLAADIDTATGRIVRSSGRTETGMGGNTLEFITRYEDYRKVDGILFPFKEGNFANGFVTGETTLSRVELLPSLPPMTFRP